MTSAARHSEKMNRTKGNKTTIIPQVLEKTTTKSFYSWSVISFRVWGILLLDARSGGYNVRRDRFVVPRPKP
jgi:hypothetical protein